MSTKVITVKDLKAALNDLPDKAEVLIQGENVLFNITGTEVSFFNSPSNKHIKLLSDLSNHTTVDKDEYEKMKASLTRLRLFELDLILKMGSL